MCDDRNPIVFFEELGKLLRANPLVKSKVRIRLAGEVDHSVKTTIEASDLIENTDFIGMITREEVFREFEKASVLLLPINKADNAAGRIPGKLFELLRAQKPILVFGPSKGDVKNIVESKEKGISFEYDDRKGISNYLQNLIIQNEVPFYNESSNIEEFSNRNMTSLIAKYLDEISTKK